VDLLGASVLGGGMSSQSIDTGGHVDAETGVYVESAAEKSRREKLEKQLEAQRKRGRKKKGFV
jgi:hypothetical protein